MATAASKSWWSLATSEAPSPAADAACAVAEAELTEAPVRTPACAHREWITRSF